MNMILTCDRHPTFTGVIDRSAKDAWRFYDPAISVLKFV